MLCGETISIICKCRLSTTTKIIKKIKHWSADDVKKTSKSSKHMRCLFLRKYRIRCQTVPDTLIIIFAV